MDTKHQACNAPQPHESTDFVLGAEALLPPMLTASANELVELIHQGHNPNDLRALIEASTQRSAA